MLCILNLGLHCSRFSFLTRSCQDHHHHSNPSKSRRSQTLRLPSTFVPKPDGFVSVSTRLSWRSSCWRCYNHSKRPSRPGKSFSHPNGNCLCVVSHHFSSTGPSTRSWITAFKKRPSDASPTKAASVYPYNQIPPRKPFRSL